MKTIGIFGATFDPLHLGHLAAARVTLLSGAVDEVWLMPSPSRWDKKPVASDELRLQWARMGACYEQANGFLAVQASDFEMKLGSFRGSYRLLTELSRSYPNVRFKLISGQDSLNSLNTWRDAQTQTINGLQLLKEFSLLVIPRGAQAGQVEIPVWAKAYESNITTLPAFSKYLSELADLGTADFLSDLSSTVIKKALMRQETLRYSLVEIQNQIASLGLYKS